MNEWLVVSVIVVLVGLLAAIIKPIVKLNTTLTELNATVKTLSRDLDTMTSKNTTSHARLWAHNEEQDATLADHETRLRVVEHGGKHE